MLGDEWTGNKTWFGNDGFLYLAPVGSFPSGGTADAIMDLAGNVWEFTESRYCPLRCAKTDVQALSVP